VGKKQKSKTLKLLKKILPKPRKPKKDASSSSGIFTKLGGALGTAFGGGPGGALGSAAGSWLSKITGFGSYKLTKNSILGAGKVGVPSFAGKDGNCVTIAHREFITTVYGSVAFNSSTYYLNPGLFATFPWLSKIAMNFEQYELLGCVFEFKSTSGSAIASDNTALGSVVLATEYNVAEPDFSDKVEMESHEFVVSGKPSSDIIHGIECNPAYSTLNLQYVRTAELVGTQDQRFYDLGKFQIATQGMQLDDVPIGELWVSYHIRLCKPRVHHMDELTYAVISESPNFSANTTQFFGTTGGIASSTSTLDVEPSTNTITLDTQGNYLLCWTSGYAKVDNFNLTVGSNISSMGVFNHGTIGTIYGVEENPEEGGRMYGFAALSVMFPGSTNANKVVFIPHEGDVGSSTYFSNCIVLKLPSNFGNRKPTIEEQLNELRLKLDGMSKDEVCYVQPTSTPVSAAKPLSSLGKLSKPAR